MAKRATARNNRGKGSVVTNNNLQKNDMNKTSGPLADLRVLEFDDGTAQYCGKLLSDLGAEVIKVEPPSGAHSRRIPPFQNDIPDLNKSLYFWHYNTNKRSVVLDLRHQDAREAVRALVRKTDVVIDGLGCKQMDGWQLGADELRSLNRRLIYARLTPFGTTGPWAEFASSDLVQLALGGTMAMTGYDDIGALGPSYPIAPSGGQANHMGSIMLAIAIMGALNNRVTTGNGQCVDVAIHDVISVSNELGIPYWEFQGSNIYRHTGRHANPREGGAREIFRARDGKWVMCKTTYIDDQLGWRALVDWFDSRNLAEDLDDARYDDASYRIENVDHIAKVIEGFCAQTHSADIFHEAQARKLPWSPVNGPWELLHDPHLIARAAISGLPGRETGERYIDAGAPYHFSKTPWDIRHSAPDLGADTEAVLRDIGRSRVELSLGQVE